MTEDRRSELARMVRDRRLALRLSIEEAAASGDMSPVTWGRVEGAERVRNLTYSGVDRALNWRSGATLAYFKNGDQPVDAGVTVVVDGPMIGSATAGAAVVATGLVSAAGVVEVSGGERVGRINDWSVDELLAEIGRRYDQLRKELRRAQEPEPQQGQGRTPSRTGASIVQHRPDGNDSPEMDVSELDITERDPRAEATRQVRRKLHQLGDGQVGGGLTAGKNGV